MPSSMPQPLAREELGLKVSETCRNLNMHIDMSCFASFSLGFWKCAAPPKPEATTSHRVPSRPASRSRFSSLWGKAPSHTSLLADCSAIPILPTSFDVKGSLGTLPQWRRTTQSRKSRRLSGLRNSGKVVPCLCMSGTLAMLMDDTHMTCVSSFTGVACPIAETKPLGRSTRRKPSQEAIASAKTQPEHAWSAWLLDRVLPLKLRPPRHSKAESSAPKSSTAAGRPAACVHKPRQGRPVLSQRGGCPNFFRGSKRSNPGPPQEQQPPARAVAATDSGCRAVQRLHQNSKNRKDLAGSGEFTLGLCHR